MAVAAAAEQQSDPLATGGTDGGAEGLVDELLIRMAPEAVATRTRPVR